MTAFLKSLFSKKENDILPDDGITPISKEEFEQFCKESSDIMVDNNYFNRVLQCFHYTKKNNASQELTRQFYEKLNRINNAIKDLYFNPEKNVPTFFFNHSYMYGFVQATDQKIAADIINHYIDARLQPMIELSKKILEKYHAESVHAKDEPYSVKPVGNRLALLYSSNIGDIIFEENYELNDAELAMFYRHVAYEGYKGRCELELYFPNFNIGHTFSIKTMEELSKFTKSITLSCNDPITHLIMSTVTNKLIQETQGMADTPKIFTATNCFFRARATEIINSIDLSQLSPNKNVLDMMDFAINCVLPIGIVIEAVFKLDEQVDPMWLQFQAHFSIFCGRMPNFNDEDFAQVASQLYNLTRYLRHSGTTSAYVDLIKGAIRMRVRSICRDVINCVAPNANYLLANTVATDEQLSTGVIQCATYLPMITMLTAQRVTELFHDKGNLGSDALEYVIFEIKSILKSAYIKTNYMESIFGPIENVISQITDVVSYKL